MRSAASSNDGTSTSRSRGSGAKESDFWVPKVTPLGEIVYFNTRTGEQSSDLPEGDQDDLGDSGGSSHLPSDEDDDIDEHAHITALAASTTSINRSKILVDGALPSAEFPLTSRPPLMVRDEKETSELHKLLETPLVAVTQVGGRAMAREEGWPYKSPSTMESRLAEKRSASAYARSMLIS